MTPRKSDAPAARSPQPIAAPPSDPLELDATGQAELIRRGALTPLELVDLAIARIEKCNPTVNAVIVEHFERARHEAAGPLPDGPFRGVPFLLKDLGSGQRAGDPVYWGTRFLREADHRATTTSFLVERFAAAGLVLLGRTNVPELGAWATTEPASYGPTRSPWDLARSSGGSSGGAAAAVACRMVPLAHASDGGGSIRNPSSQCGLFGLKPSCGRITLGPELAESWAGMIVEFAVTRTVRDAARLLDAVAGPAPGDPYVLASPGRPWARGLDAPPTPLRIGFTPSFPDMTVHPDCVAAVEDAARLLASLGHHVEPGCPDGLGDPAMMQPILHVIAAGQAHQVAEFERALGRPIGPDDMDADNWTLTEMGRAVTGVQYLDALDGLNRFRRRTAAWWAGGFDLLLTPTIPEPSPRLGELVPDPARPMQGFARSGGLLAFLVPWNVTGQPAASVPLRWNDAGLPTGVQLVAASGREDLLIGVAAQLERARPWAGRAPPLLG
jgi:amidase